MPASKKPAVKKTSKLSSSTKPARQNPKEQASLRIESVVKAAAEALLGYMIMLARRDEASVLHESALYEPFYLTVLSRGYSLRHEVRVEEKDGKSGDKCRVDFAIFKQENKENVALVEMKLMATNVNGKQRTATAAFMKDDIEKLLSISCFPDIAGEKEAEHNVTDGFLILCNCKSDDSLMTKPPSNVDIMRIAEYRYANCESNVHKNVLVYKMNRKK